MCLSCQVLAATKLPRVLVHMLFKSSDKEIQMFEQIKPNENQLIYFLC